MIAFINSVLGLFGLKLVHEVPAPAVRRSLQVPWSPKTQAEADAWRMRGDAWMADQPYLGNERERAAFCYAMARWHDNGQLGQIPSSPGWKSERYASHR